MTDPDRQTDPASRLLDAALNHVAFDGWSEETFRAACRDTGIAPAAARSLFPRGGIDLALAFHMRGDAEMLRRLALEDLPTLRLRERIAMAVRLRIEATHDREAVRRGVAVFALPHHAGEGARALWTTADRIWTALGDQASDINWYSKRASLAGVYSATLLYWLGDESEGSAQSWAFLDARIDGVMRVGKLRARLTGNPLGRALLAGPNRLAGRIRRPGTSGEPLPGRWSSAG